MTQHARRYSDPPSLHAVGVVVAKAAEWRRDFITPTLRRHRLEYGEDLLLMELEIGTLTMQNDLALRLEMNKGSLSRTVRRLATIGFVRRVRDATDKRIVRIGITPLGQTVKPIIADIWRDADAEIATRVGSAEDYGTFNDLLLRLIVR